MPSVQTAIHLHLGPVQEFAASPGQLVRRALNALPLMTTKIFMVLAIQRSSPTMMTNTTTVSFANHDDFKSHLHNQLSRELSLPRLLQCQNFCCATRNNGSLIRLGVL